MNRRSFLKGVLAAMVAPAILVPKCPDHHRFKCSRRRGLYIMEFHYAVKPYNPEDLREVMFFEAQPDVELLPNPDYTCVRRYRSPEYIAGMERHYAGKWEFITV